MEPPKLSLLQRILLLAAGTPLIAVGVGIFLFCRLGTDPSVTLFQGVSAILHIPFTYALLLVSIPIAIVCIILHRNLLGAGSVLNMLTIGPLGELIEGLLLRAFPKAGIPLRAGMFLVGLLILSFGLVLYVAANLGMPPIDTISLMITKHVKLPFKWIRVIQDVTAISTGVTLGLLAHMNWQRLIGPGTVVIALGLGPLMNFWFRLLFEREKKSK